MKAGRWVGWTSTLAPLHSMAQKVQDNSQSSCHQSVLIQLVGKVRTLLPIRNDPSISFQWHLPLLLPFRSLFYKQVLIKLALPNQNLGGVVLEICIIHSKWLQWSGKSGKSYYRTFKLLILHHKWPASCPFCVFLPSATCLPSPAGDTHFPILQVSVKIPPNSTTLNTLIHVVLISSIG